jgi:hypothetical protein
VASATIDSVHLDYVHTGQTAPKERQKAQEVKAVAKKANKAPGIDLKAHDIVLTNAEIKFMNSAPIRTERLPSPTPTYTPPISRITKSGVRILYKNGNREIDTMIFSSSLGTKCLGVQRIMAGSKFALRFLRSDLSKQAWGA